MSEYFRFYTVCTILHTLIFERAALVQKFFPASGIGIELIMTSLIFFPFENNATSFLTHPFHRRFVAARVLERSSGAYVIK